MMRRTVHLALVLAAILGVGARLAHSASADTDVLGAVSSAAAGVDVSLPLPAGAGPDEIIGAVESFTQRAADAGAETVLLGVASDAQREAVGASARLVLALSGEAMRKIDSLLSRPGPRTDETQRLAVARETILPLRAARACLWLGSCAETPQARAEWTRHAQAIATQTEPLTTWSVAERGTVLGLADLRLGDAEAALEPLVEAIETLRENAALRESRTLRMEASIGAALATTGLRSPDAAYSILDALGKRPPFIVENGLRDWSMALLLADVAHRIGMMDVGTGDNRSEVARVVERSVTRYAALVGADDTTHPDLAERRRDVEERIRRVVSATGVDPTRFPALVAASIGAGVDASDPDERAGAVAMLNASIGSVPLDRDPFAPDLYFQLGRLEAASGDPQDAARAGAALLRFASLAPRDARTPAALAAACAAALRAPASPEGRELSLGALRAALASPTPVPHADTWRLQLARLLIEDMRGRPIQSRWPAMLEASDALRSVEGAESRTSAGEALAAMWLEGVERLPEDDATLEWTERVGAAGGAEAEVIVAMLNGASSSQAGEARAAAALLAGQSHLALNQPEEALGALPADADAPASPGLRARISRTRFLALIALGRAGDAFGALSTLGSIDMGRALVTLGGVERRASGDVEPRVQEFPNGTPDPSVASSADILARAVAWREDNGAPVPAALRVNAARALVFAGRAADAVGLLSIKAKGAPSADRLIVLGEGQLAEREEAAAFDAFRLVAVALEPGQTAERAYWHAWSRMLEILERRNPDGARSADIRREIARLRTLDSWGTFPDCTARLEAVGRAVGP